MTWLFFLEVAEHLPKETAGSTIECLTDLSDFMLLSAAIPFQGEEILSMNSGRVIGLFVKIMDILHSILSEKKPGRIKKYQLGISKTHCYS